ncbi:unnamed protein product [Paramecium primaurelia]|uniref:Uncharacterized protein n=1 Tax=Paramecium primaurelia TaxID=5886 RepID=A0A8S1PHM7_PARPR|nr:unnamed protein product [Paramecium primaurelia]
MEQFGSTDVGLTRQKAYSIHIMSHFLLRVKTSRSIVLILKNFLTKYPENSWSQNFKVLSENIYAALDDLSGFLASNMKQFRVYSQALDIQSIFLK